MSKDQKDQKPFQCSSNEDTRESPACVCLFIERYNPGSASSPYPVTLNRLPLRNKPDLFCNNKKSTNDLRPVNESKPSSDVWNQLIQYFSPWCNISSKQNKWTYVKLQFEDITHWRVLSVAFVLCIGNVMLMLVWGTHLKLIYCGSKKQINHFAFQYVELSM